MKVIGLIGGMSWESSLEYYRIINTTVKERLGGLHSARCLMFSLDFEEIEKYQHQNNWDAAAEILVDGAKRLERGGADFIVVCTNTMHKLASSIEQNLNIPLLHIADPTAELVSSFGISRVGLLGTKFTMEQDFYKGRLEEKYGLDVIIPDKPDRDYVHEVIYQELCQGKIIPSSRNRYRNIMKSLVQYGAQGIILGCTEISLLVRPEDGEVSLFDTTSIHAKAAVDFALEGEK